MARIRLGDDPGRPDRCSPRG
ncbi:hypothetical protein EVA_05507, partial [gut metagenome]